MKANEIFNRINEITFNSSLLKEFRAIAFVQKLLDEGWIKDEFKDKLKHILLHSIRADIVLRDLSAATKISSEWEFLTMLRDRGRAAADEWLSQNYDALGKRSSVDLKESYLSGGSHPGHDD